MELPLNSDKSCWKEVGEESDISYRYVAVVFNSDFFGDIN